MMETFLQDIRYAMRNLLKSRTVTLIAVITMALGIGANTMIFSIVNTVLLEPLPFEKPAQLVNIWEVRTHQDFRQASISPAEFISWRERATSFTQMTAFDFTQFNLTDDNLPEQVAALVATANYFEVFGIKPLFGRSFTESEDQPGQNQVVILSYGLWQRRFAGDPRILNQRVLLDGVSCEVIGVMPNTFLFPDNTQLARPIAFTPQQRSNFGTHDLQVIGRINADLSQTQAESELKTLAEEMERTGIQTNVGHSIKLVSLYEQTVGDSRAALLLLLVAVGLVLLIACANVANLLLTRAAGRQREIAIRIALGATRGRLIRQLLSESLVLSIIGGVFGLLLAWWGVDLLVGMAKGNLPRFNEVVIDSRALGVTFILAVVTGLAFGLAPALQATRPQLNESLKENGKAVTASRGRNRTRNLLVVSEVALTMILLIGAGLLLKSFFQLRSVKTGFQPDHLLVMDISLPQKYANRQQIATFFDQALSQIATIPGVEAVGATSVLPFSGNNNSGSFTIEGRPPSVPGQSPNANRRSITPEYFQAMGMRLIKGREFNAQDTATSQPVVIINETTARIFWPGEEVLGKRLRLGSGDNLNTPWLDIIGVVEDIKHLDLKTPTRQELYFPFAQSPMRALAVAVRTTGEPLRWTAPVRHAVLEIDKDQPIGNVHSMEELMAQSITTDRLTLQTLGAFSALAVLLAVIGIYGVMSYTVRQRTNEIGIRMALGAQGHNVLWLILRQGMRLALAGVAIGFMGALALTGLLKKILFEVSAADPLIFIAVSLLLTGVALVACLVPARRAMNLDPLVALREE
jgi:putative ABC transport system permease protein